MKKTYLSIMSLAFATAILTSHAESISPEEAHAIGIEAYLYFYSLVSMDITRKQLTNVEQAEESVRR